MVTTADAVTEPSNHVAAFQGAYTPDPTIGFTGENVQHFVTVEAQRLQLQPAGDYALICAVPGHAPAGMWLSLVVTDDAETATLTVPDGTVYEAQVGTPDVGEATPGATPTTGSPHG